jgi:RNA polymerase-binding transcription factor DksA
MTKSQLTKYRDRLRAMAQRLDGTVASLEDGARAATGGELSGAPLHLGDIGSEVYTQELNATLLENEEYLRGEVNDALDRIDRGAFGTCEECGTAIGKGRLAAVPYARHCAACATALQSGKRVNLNDGRATGRDTLNPHDDGSDPVHFAGAGRGDAHAAGTAGGGTPVGGLAGTNVGTGDPADADLANATGRARFDAPAGRPPVDTRAAGRKPRPPRKT